MNVPTVLTFDPDGRGHCLYTEAIALHQIGELSVVRATSIEFNPTTQQWDVTDAGGVILHSDPSRSRCLAWEHERFNQ